MTTIVLLWEREANTWHLTVLMAYCTFHSKIFCAWFFWNGDEKHDAFILTVLVLLALFITLDHEIFFFVCKMGKQVMCLFVSGLWLADTFCYEQHRMCEATGGNQMCTLLTSCPESVPLTWERGNIWKRANSSLPVQRLL